MSKRLKCPKCGSSNTRFFLNQYVIHNKYPHRLYICNVCLFKWDRTLELKKEKQSIKWNLWQKASDSPISILLSKNNH